MNDPCTFLNKVSIMSKTNRTYRNIAAASTSNEIEFGTPGYYFYCGIGGALCCGLTHTLVVPLDMVKTRLQVNPTKYKNLIHGFKLSIKEDGPKGLVKGWAPTLIGYSFQGLCKFGFYEYFKVLYTDMLSEENAYLYRTLIYLAASSSAEFIADIPLSPFEATRVKLQTSDYAKNMREAMPKMYKEEGLTAFYKSLIPLWCRQVPYTMMKFAMFERTVEALYKYIVPKPREKCTKAEQLVVTFAAGYIAGVFCALVSHPADTILSKLNQQKGLSILDVSKKMGFFGVWKGLETRIIMIGTLTALQWFIYDSFKVAFHIPRPPPPEMPKSLRDK